jgi:hypothetical protein
MQWSKIKKRVTDLICDSLKGRIDFHLTSYRKDYQSSKVRGPDGSTNQWLGRAWVTVDGKEILSFSGKSGGLLWGERKEMSKPSEGWESSRLAYENKGPEDRQELYEVIKEYPSLSIDDALESPRILARGLALVDRRLGKRRLAKPPSEDEHDFVKLMYKLRCEAEGISYKG